MTTEKKTKNQKGFTLVEIAIVLVIIGLLLGGVLKGQELIQSSKIKAMASDVNSYRVALLAYEDRFGRDIFRNGSGYLTAPSQAQTPTSAEMINELVARGFIANKESHALGGEIFLAKAGGLGYDNSTTRATIANNASAAPANFNWAICYREIGTADLAQRLISAIDGTTLNGTNVTWDGNNTTSGYRTGRARITTPAHAIGTYSATNNNICIELL
ncbi:prepilin-type N-terminal cleavage/methylation domain-containing protein [Thiomicrospira microaerophila]|uniref:prepilin-type N-terminal cleavage/methylation domain-containing protein n=1 Tax=Thiomicrospira microaerophila TaxID=406020 RepID=UPI0005C84970|nr:prepilin-type N-terminal cleavage/methylation domain-containing protein [Thiomicrospira microaerophila]